MKAGTYLICKANDRNNKKYISPVCGSGNNKHIYFLYKDNPKLCGPLSLCGYQWVNFQYSDCNVLNLKYI